eukprot:TRINITY_DN22569_c0_g1_i1.p1 TRINITY_DN22569_c0_g1~~TRINITY_DN22569_c0_g1_i1.p1  ORF type:complete len:622 (+),score=89.82 TRINITY_DN22569_c0_g1_i1:212-1867(+)
MAVILPCQIPGYKALSPKGAVNALLRFHAQHRCLGHTHGIESRLPADVALQVYEFLPLGNRMPELIAELTGRRDGYIGHAHFTGLEIRAKAIVCTCLAARGLQHMSWNMLCNPWSGVEYDLRKAIKSIHLLRFAACSFTPYPLHPTKILGELTNGHVFYYEDLYADKDKEVVHDSSKYWLERCRCQDLPDDDPSDRTDSESQGSPSEMGYDKYLSAFLGSAHEEFLRQQDKFVFIHASDLISLFELMGEGVVAGLVQRIDDMKSLGGGESETSISEPSSVGGNTSKAESGLVQKIDGMCLGGGERGTNISETGPLDHHASETVRGVASWGAKTEVVHQWEEEEGAVIDEDVAASQMQLQADEDFAKLAEEQLRNVDPWQSHQQEKVHLIGFRSGNGTKFRQMILSCPEFGPLRSRLLDAGYSVVQKPSKAVFLVYPDQYLDTIASLASHTLKPYQVVITECLESTLAELLQRMRCKDRPQPNKQGRKQLDLSINFVSKRTFICEAPRLLPATGDSQSTTEAVTVCSGGRTGYFSYKRGTNPRRHAFGSAAA